MAGGLGSPARDPFVCARSVGDEPGTDPRRVVRAGGPAGLGIFRRQICQMCLYIPILMNRIG